MTDNLKPPAEAERTAAAQAIHDGPNAQAQYRLAGIPAHTWEECWCKDQYYADADAVLAAGFRLHQHPPGRCCGECGMHVSPHRGCILR